MINPAEITKFDRTDYELEEFLLFAIAAAGKTAATQAKKLAEFLLPDISPFEYIRQLIKDGVFLARLKDSKLGKYDLLLKGFTKVTGLDPRTCTLQDLLKVPGIGFKTAKLFLCHSRENERHAVLDTHILKWLSAQGYAEVPKVSPQDETRYRIFENYFLAECDKRKTRPATLDLEIWNYYSNKK